MAKEIKLSHVKTNMVIILFDYITLPALQNLKILLCF